LSLFPSCDSQQQCAFPGVVRLFFFALESFFLPLLM
jgi:hypothetical protein